MTKRDYKQFCPAARALNVVGERWTLLIVRDLLLGPQRYSDLRRSLRGMASNLLAARLREMEAAGLVVRRRVDGPTPRDLYALTDRGRELESLLLELARFGFPLLDMPTDEQPMVAERIPLALRALLYEPELPAESLVIRFDLDEGHHLVAIEAQENRGTRRYPGERISVTPVPTDDSPPSDAVVRGSLAGLLWIRQGLIDLDTAIADGLLTLRGDAAAQQQVRYLYRLDSVAA